MPSVICEDCQEIQSVRSFGTVRCEACGSVFLSSVDGYETAEPADH